MEDRRRDDELLADHRQGLPLAEIAARHRLAGPEEARDAVSAALRRLDARIARGLDSQAARRAERR